jgi:3-deoxy-D-manno-octulosonic-acid transferase
MKFRKNNTVADVTVYLPLDTKKNAQQFLQLVHPDLVFFIKYEYWPNYLFWTQKSNTKTYFWNSKKKTNCFLNGTVVYRDAGCIYLLLFKMKFLKLQQLREKQCYCRSGDTVWPSGHYFRKR